MYLFSKNAANDMALQRKRLRLQVHRRYYKAKALYNRADAGRTSKMNSKNVIELNGKHYDVITGNVLDLTKLSPKKPVVPIQTNGKKTVDGVFHAQRSTPASQLHHKVTPPAQPRTASAVAKPTITIVKTPVTSTAKPAATIRTANHAVHHQLQAATTLPRTSIAKPAKQPGLIASTAKMSTIKHAVNPAANRKTQTATTLMRTAVTKPGAGFKKSINVQTALQGTQPNNIIVKKTSVNSVTPERVERAQAVNRSQHITHYGGEIKSAVAISVAPLAVQAPPAAAPAPAPRQDNKPVDIFEQAIANASNFVDSKANTTHYRKKVRFHAASMVAGLFAIILLASFVTYQNSPSLQVKAAGFHAGVAAAMPNLQRTGFHWAGVTSQFGKVTVGLSIGNSKYMLTQQATNWSSNDMINNVASVDASGAPNYQLITAGNTAVYRFSNSGATWVKNGTWYQVSGQQPLSDTQIKALAQNS